MTVQQKIIVAEGPAPSAATAAFLAADHRLFIGGRWVEAAEGGQLDVENPATGEIVARVPAGTAADIDAAVAAARQAFDHGPWSRMTPSERGRLVWKLADLLETHADEFAEIDSIDNGKPVTDARAVDVAFSCELLRYMAGWSTKIHGQTIALSSSAPFHAYTLREPVGVVGQIVPWNFPLMMAVWKVAPALAAGCTIVLKPAEQTPLSALRLAQLVEEVGFPAGVFNVVTGLGETAGAALAAHPDVDKVAFTGSTEVGKLILGSARGNLKKVSLELGGKSPVIVFPDADLDVALAGAASAIFYNMGQCCTAGSRLYIHRKVYDRLMAGMAAEAARLPVGVGLDPATRIGPLVSAEQLARVFGYIEAGQREGATVLTGGRRIGDRGFFLEPTVLTGTTPGMSVVREEIFGPVVCAMPFDDDDIDAIVAEANSSIYGLAASLYTRDLSKAHTVARRLKAGTIGVNVHHVVDVALPFGGFKQSGWGREMGYAAIELYTETKSIAVAL
ncbi:phenylacetaldehyde dehydrogenase [Pseudoxanthobacter soli DSM 19599]|uniref:Phenylacetaldehyde dehydrogenase n=1 Tax=Pseudoxanthobacter soli DSM 19599 TaxID=1123029 RepID=A0A1M7ZLZ4_9HYPH|nr:aldehyde dehydrogenase family protein [Pseudoxanthobacter soli]SHO65915.1 phenylacetaldehyde dehydrogenase [Pseudoxanthobacter soli DSM 19599]